jgi:translation initiation factor 3 subunit I
LWYADDGTRVGTYEGHNGAVWTCEISLDSSRLITSSADQTVRAWDLPTGRELQLIRMNEPCRACALSVGEKMLAFTTDSFMGAPPQIHIVDVDMAGDGSDAAPIFKLNEEGRPRMTIDAPKGRVTRVAWVDCNKVLLTSHDGGWLRRWDANTGELLEEAQVHEDAIQDMQMAPDGTYVITASLDKTARLVDVSSLEVLKTYKTGRFVQSAAVSPLMDHVLCGGGQDASQVTTTSAKAGGFEARFFHRVYAEEFGSVRGHFGPINSVAFAPDGRSFVTGGEDGYVRVHHFDNSYFTDRFF